MDGKSPAFTAPHYEYSALERAFLVFFKKTQPSRLLARLKHLQRLKVVGVAPGKGQRIAYTREQVCKLYLTLVMSELMIEPTTTVRYIDAHWDKGLLRLSSLMRQATEAPGVADNPYYLTLQPTFMSNPTNPVAWIGRFRHYEKSGELGVELMIKRAEEAETWLCIRNLTADLTKLYNALES